MAARTLTRLLAAALAVAALAGCDPYALQRRQAAMAAYIGTPEADLVRQLGVPSRSFEANGHRFIAYDQSSVDIVPPIRPWEPWAGFGWGYGGDFPAQVVQHSCETTFEVAGGHVVGVSLRGDACG